MTRGRGRRTVDTCAQTVHLLDEALDARLREDIVVLDAVEELGQAPERVGLERLEDRGRERRHVERLGVGICGRTRRESVRFTSNVIDSRAHAAPEVDMRDERADAPM